jgi:hypothetical protein
MRKKLWEEDVIFEGAISGAIMGANAPICWTQTGAWILALLFGILGGSIAAIAVGMPMAPESESGTRAKKADPSAAAWEIPSL